MKAVVFLGSGKWELRDVAEPRVQAADDVLLEVERTGICGTDLHILSDPPGHPATAGTILGHEYVARVLECGSGVHTLKRGDRVVIDPNITCGECDCCRLGRTNMCSRMTTLGIFRDGGLARYNVAPARALYTIAPSVPPERAVLAEPLSCINAAFEKAPLHPGDRVVVLGAGPIGLLFILMYRRMGAGTIVAVEPRDFRRRVAEELGADAVVDPTAEDLAAGVRKILPCGADLVVDAAGSLMAAAVDISRAGGTVILFGMIQNSSQPVSQYEITRKELTLVGSFIQRSAFPKVTRLLEKKDFVADRIISHCLPLQEIGSALDSMRRGLALKVILNPSA